MTDGPTMAGGHMARVTVPARRLFEKTLMREFNDLASGADAMLEDLLNKAYAAGLAEGYRQGARDAAQTY